MECCRAACCLQARRISPWLTASLRVWLSKERKHFLLSLFLGCRLTGSSGCRSSGKCRLIEDCTSRLRRWRGQRSVQRKPCAARLFARTAHVAARDCKSRAAALDNPGETFLTGYSGRLWHAMQIMLFGTGRTRGSGSGNPPRPHRCRNRCFRHPQTPCPCGLPGQNCRA